MKKFVPIALLLCVLFSMSGFAPAHSRVLNTERRVIPLTFPVTGQTYGKQGLLNYEVIGSGSTPYNIKFYYNGTQVGTSYPFTTTPASGGVWTAVGMKDATGINGVEFTVYSGSGGTEYNIDFFSPF